VRRVGFHCEAAEEIEPALAGAFAAKGPALVEAVVDPFEPPLPARATPTQALHLAEALARGEPHAGRIALTIFRDKVRDLGT
jgi:pyruvate dehydrogenase (quinone)/pyruvate oxidase